MSVESDQEKHLKDMFAKFTTSTRRMLLLAEQEARQFNHHYIGTEHLLLGVLDEDNGGGATILEQMGIRLKSVRHAIEFLMQRGDRIVTGNIGLTPRSKKVLELSADEAYHLGHSFISTEHVLLGLIREGEGIAGGVLQRFGVDLSHARIEVTQALLGNSAI